VILEAWGQDLAACCEEAVAALAGTYLVDAEVSTHAVRRLRVVASSAEDLVVEVLEEVLFLLDTASDVPVAAQVRQAQAGGFDVEIALADRGSVEPTGSVPKAISRSGLEVTAEPAAVRCSFLVDL
jgi:SHS2 domain-containing protein